MDSIPFPQADDFEKIVTIVNISDSNALNDSVKLSQTLGGITDRQVAYYLSAATFLGLIESEKGQKRFAQKCLEIRNINSYLQTAELISLILQNPVFSKVYSYTIVIGIQEVEDIKEVIKEYYPQYSDAIYERRAQTVLSWINWIIEKTQG